MKITDIFNENKLAIQQTGFSCGPCSILNILNMKGKAGLSEAELIDICKAEDGKGTSHENILNAVNKAGLEVVDAGIDGKIADIERHIDAGYSVIINYYHLYLEVGHYAVAVEYDDKALYFLDSEFGLFRLEKEPFAKNWHNTDKSVYGWYAAIK
ncbi:MAG: cysteine peptidase family C39 domain-containing protein [Planctomycetota bacterium]|jgi:predicted double-glycine peptidase